MVNAEKLITDHLPLWSSTIKARKTVGRGSSKKRVLYGVKKLRELILDLAVRGLLVPQNSNDEPASKLLKRVAQKKAQLIAEKKIKKTKPLPTTELEEFNYTLPPQWSISRFGDIYHMEYGDSLPASKRIDTGSYPVYGSNGIVGTHDKYKLEEPCIVIGRKGSAGALNLCPEGQCWVTDVAYSLTPLADSDLHYTLIHLQTQGLNTLGKGIKPGLNRNEAYVLPIAIPPLAEQQRIVAKVDELMALCDMLEQQQEDSIDTHETLVKTLLDALTTTSDPAQFQQAWQRIEANFHLLFTTESSVDHLKQTILQLAVMGKLVPQDPNDEPASQLLKKIATEKAQLIKDKKIKKQKPLPPILNKETPFQLPNSWSWGRLNDVGIGATGKTPKTAISSNFGGDIQFIGPGQITPTGNLLRSDKTLTEEGLEGSTEALPGDILMVCIGGSIGKSVITDRRVAFNQQINTIRPIFVSSDFLNHSVSTDFFYNSVLEKASGSATPIINRSKWEELLVPIAPLAEQQRIVAKVDSLMTLCDTLKAKLQSAQNTQQTLTDTIVSSHTN